MMHIDLIAADERGVTQSEWLESKHSFSFGRYYDPKKLNFGTLRVLNDDVIGPGRGFGMHSHDNMEIVTIVLKGAVRHKDSMGNEKVISTGEVQRMTAGSGVRHSEVNSSSEEPLHLLQIWVYPQDQDLTPSYEQKEVAPLLYQNKFTPVVSPERSEPGLFIHQDATFYLGDFDPNITVVHKLKSKAHGVYLFVIDGHVRVGQQELKKADAAQISSTDQFEMKTNEESRVLLIEVRTGHTL